MTNNVENLSMCSLGIYVLFCMKWPVEAFCPSFTELSFLLSTCKSSFCNVNIIPLMNTCTKNLITQSMVFFSCSLCFDEYAF